MPSGRDAYAIDAWMGTDGGVRRAERVPCSSAASRASSSQRAQPGGTGVKRRRSVADWKHSHPDRHGSDIRAVLRASAGGSTSNTSHSVPERSLQLRIVIYHDP